MPRTVTGPPMSAPPVRNVPASMRSPTVVCSQGCRLSTGTPSTSMSDEPPPDTRAPMAFSMFAKIDDLRFARGVLHGGGALGRHGGHEQVLRGAHAGEVQHDVRAGQAVRRGGLQEAVVHHELHAQGLQPHEVHVDLAGADLAAARHGDARLAEPPDERAQHGDARAHLRHQLVGGLPLVHGAGVHHERVALALNARVQAAQHLGHDGDIRDERHVVDGGGSTPQQGGGHELERRVLRARHGNLAGQHARALHDDDFFSHGLSFAPGPKAAGHRSSIVHAPLPRRRLQHPAIIESEGPHEAGLHSESRRADGPRSMRGLTPLRPARSA